MSASPVAGAEFKFVGYRQCEYCDEMDPCYSLVLTVVDNTVETPPRCLSCCLDIEEPLELPIRVRDVIPVDRKAKRRSINKTATKRERACAEQIGGRTTPASGSGTAKGDARTDEWMIDDKHTTSVQTFPIKRSDVIKAHGQAHRSGRKAALKVGFPDLEVAVLGWDDFVELICRN